MGKVYEQLRVHLCLLPEQNRKSQPYPLFFTFAYSSCAHAHYAFSAKIAPDLWRSTFFCCLRSWLDCLRFFHGIQSKKGNVFKGPDPETRPHLLSELTPYYTNWPVRSYYKLLHQFLKFSIQFKETVYCVCQLLTHSSSHLVNQSWNKCILKIVYPELNRADALIHLLNEVLCKTETECL